MDKIKHFNGTPPPSWLAPQVDTTPPDENTTGPSIELFTPALQPIAEEDEITSAQPQPDNQSQTETAPEEDSQIIERERPKRVVRKPKRYEH